MNFNNGSSENKNDFNSKLLTWLRTEREKQSSCKREFYFFQVNTEVICDLQFNPKYPDVMAISGKEYLAWWKIYPDSRMIQPLAQPNYEVKMLPYNSKQNQQQNTS